MSQFITQTVLPISLAVIMLGIGLSVKLTEFSKLKNDKRSIFGGFFLQIIGLPALAFVLINVFGIRQEYAVAMLLASACPGGVTSNALTFIFSGAIALSIVLTLLSSLVAPFSIPLVTKFGLGHFISDTARHEFPLAGAVIKLFVLSIVPLAVGNIIQRMAPACWCEKNSDKFRKFSGWWFLALIIAMIATNYTLLFKVVMNIGWMIFAIAMGAICLGFFGAKLLRLGPVYRLTLAIEVGGPERRHGHYYYRHGPA